MRNHQSANTTKSPKRPQKYPSIKSWIVQQTPRKMWRRFNWWQKTIEIIVVVLLLSLGTMYGIARWYIAQQSNNPLTLGVSFIPDYASFLGLDAKQTMQAIINDLGVRNFRLTSYWSDIEPSPGVYNFTDLDWEFQMADQSNSKVILAIGLRQPRWPECHMPAWVQNEPESVWYPQLTTFMGKVIDRYKNNPALQSYQLENEYFLKFFGQCTNFSRQRLVDELSFVHKTDPSRPVIIARSNNAIGFPVGSPTPDELGVSVYKRVWDSEITHRYLEYPFPAWFYAFLAGGDEIITGKNTIIHELQAEAWMPKGAPITTSNIAEQNKSMNPTILKNRIQYGEATGIKTIYVWGAEWWYWRLVAANDPSLWNVAKQQFSLATAYNNNLALNKLNSLNKNNLVFQKYSFIGSTPATFTDNNN